MDIRCSICGEPWDSYGVNNGDMLPWEAKLFNQGAGCPACEGVKPDGVDADETYIDSLRSRLINGLDDYHQQDLIMSDHDHHSKWERPADPLLWECNNCCTKVFENIDDKEHYARGCNADELERQNSNSYWRGVNYVWDPLRIEPALERNGYKYCECCVKTCDHCGDQYVEGDDCTYSVQTGCTEWKDACSEECLSAIEWDEFLESWKYYGASDLRRSLVKAFDLKESSEQLLDDTDDDYLSEWWMDHANEPYTMSSEGAYIDVGHHVNRMTRDDIAQLLWSVRKRHHEQSSSTTGAQS